MAKRNLTKRRPAGYDFDRPAAAGYSGCASATFADYARRGEGPPYVIAGGKAWYRRADLDRWMERRIRRPASAAA
jgi:hypothetical protein